MPTEKPESPATNQVVEDLVSCVSELVDQVAILREAIDDLREEFAWAVQNGRVPQQLSPPFLLKSMPKDPTAPDWAARLNQATADPQTPEVTEQDEESVAGDDGMTKPDEPPTDKTDSDEPNPAAPPGQLFA